MRASAHQARTVVERTEDATRRLEQQRVAQERGAQAVRNRSGAVLLLDPASPTPLLQAQVDANTVAPDAALRFGNSSLEVRDPTDSGYRDLGVRGIDARGTVHSTGAVTAVGGVYTDFEIIAQSGIRSEFGISSAGDIFSSARVYADNLSITGNSIWSWPRNGAIRWETGVNEGALAVCTRDGLSGRGVFATNFAPWGSSWRAIKRDVRPAVELFGATAGEVVDRLEVSAHRYDPERAPAGYDCDEQRFGPMLDELPEALRFTRVDDEGVTHTSYDTTKLLAVALDALQETRAELAALRDRVAELEQTAPA